MQQRLAIRFRMTRFSSSSIKIEMNRKELKEANYQFIGKKKKEILVVSKTLKEIRVGYQ